MTNDTHVQKNEINKKKIQTIFSYLKLPYIE